MTSGKTSTAPAIETHSINPIPEGERAGKVWHQGPFWFMINATILTVLSGVYGSLAGLSLVWSLVAIVAGTLFGTIFAAFHAVQGPRLGLPQMIQSRVQFGSRGAAWLLAIVVLMDTGFAVFFVIMGRDSLGQLVTPHPNLYAAILVVGATFAAIFGYHFIHRVQRFFSVIALLVFSALTVAVFAGNSAGSLFGHGAFLPTVFLLQFGISTGYQITVAPLMSSYTRYLPRDVSAVRLGTWVFAGSALAAIWLESLGAAVAIVSPQADFIQALSSTGQRIIPGSGTALEIVTFASMFGITAVCLYEAMLSGMSLVDAFRPVRTSARMRSIWIVALAAAVYLLIIWLPKNHLTDYNSFLLLMLYLLVPWTSVNLLDYYFIRKGHCVVSEIARPDGGIYGRWGKAGIAAYCAGVAAMVPFLSNPLYSGPVAKMLGGADVTVAVGVVVSAAIYYWLAKRGVGVRTKA